MRDVLVCATLTSDDYTDEFSSSSRSRSRSSSSLHGLRRVGEHDK